MKKVIKLTESDLHRIVENSVNRILNEIGDTQKGQYMLGRLQRRYGNKKGTAGFYASGARDDAAENNYQNGGSYEATHNNLRRAYRDGFEGKEW